MRRPILHRRGMAWTIRLLVLALAISTARTGFVAAQAKGPKKSDGVVKASLKAEPEKPGAGGRQVVTVTLEVEKKWHIYANPVGNDDLKDSQTVVTVTGKSSPKVKVEYPAGKVIKDKVVGDYKVYEDKVAIKLTVERNAGDKEPLEVNVKFQACDDKSCLLPATVKLTIP